MCGTGGNSTSFHHSIPSPARASGRANGCRRSSRSPHGVATTAVTTRSTTTVDSMNQNRQSGPEPRLAEDPVEQADGRQRVLPGDDVGGGDHDDRRGRDAAQCPEQPADAGPAVGAAEGEPRQVVADEEEERVGGALELEDVGVGADDEQDRDGAQDDARLEGAGPEPAVARTGGPGPRMPSRPGARRHPPVRRRHARPAPRGRATVMTCQPLGRWPRRSSTCSEAST